METTWLPAPERGAWWFANACHRYGVQLDPKDLYVAVAYDAKSGLSIMSI